jgi:hypothetical protein
VTEAGRYEHHFARAEHWLAESYTRTEVVAARERLATAAVHAVLALAAAIGGRDQ